MIGVLRGTIFGGDLVFWGCGTQELLSLDRVSTCAYHRDLKASELRRKLAKVGCTFVDSKKHLIIYYKGNRSLMPRHPAKEVKTGTVEGILKKLGIEEL